MENSKNCKTICPVPWLELASTSSGRIRLCCNSISPINLSVKNDQSVAKIYEELNEGWNSSFFQTVRKKMLNGEKVSACEKCYAKEAAGHISPRQSWLEKYPQFLNQNLSEVVDVKSIEHLDLRLGNKCNIKCRMCSPYSSSSWLNEWDKLGNLVEVIDAKTKNELSANDWPENPFMWQQFYDLVPQLKSIYFTGGEPLLIAANKHFLQYCIQHDFASKIELRYNTNGTSIDEEYINLWKHFKRVELIVSIDGLYQLNDYIRYPSSFPKILENLEKINSIKHDLNLELKIGCTVQIYNIFHIAEMVHFFKEKEIPVYFEVLQEPSFLSITTLPSNLATLAKGKLENVKDYYSVAHIEYFLNGSNEFEWPNFIAYTKKLDQLRNQDIKKIVPELNL